MFASLIKKSKQKKQKRVEELEIKSKVKIVIIIYGGFFSQKFSTSFFLENNIKFKTLSSDYTSENNQIDFS